MNIYVLKFNIMYRPESILGAQTDRKLLLISEIFKNIDNLGMLDFKIDD